METAQTVVNVRDILYVYVFESAHGADGARHAIRALDKQAAAGSHGNIAVVRRAAGGAVSVNETADLPYRSRIASALPFVGMAAGFIAQDRGLLKLSGTAAALAGGALGLALALAVNVVDLGFDDSALAAVGRTLKADSSALLMLCSPEDQQLLAAMLGKAGGTPMDASLDPALSAQLRSTLFA